MTGLVLLIAIVVVSYLSMGWEGIGGVVVSLAAAFLLIWQAERFADRAEKGSGGGRFGDRIREERRRRDEKDGET